MTDRELLELAAKAAGYEIQRMCDPVESGNACSEFFHLDGRYWNPLTDDGDTFRLAVACRIRFGVARDTGKPRAVWFVGGCTQRSDMQEQPERVTYRDERDWLRRTVVQAAAEIGASMK